MVKCWCGKNAKFSHSFTTHTTWNVFECEEGHDNTISKANDYNSDDWGVSPKVEDEE